MAVAEEAAAVVDAPVNTLVHFGACTTVDGQGVPGTEGGGFWIDVKVRKKWSEESSDEAVAEEEKESGGSHANSGGIPKKALKKIEKATLKKAYSRGGYDCVYTTADAAVRDFGVDKSLLEKGLRRKKKFVRGDDTVRLVRLDSGVAVVAEGPVLATPEPFKIVELTDTGAIEGRDGSESSL